MLKSSNYSEFNSLRSYNIQNVALSNDMRHVALSVLYSEINVLINMLQVKQRHMDKYCECSGRYINVIRAEEFKKTLELFNNIAK